MLRLVSDADFNGRIVRGLFRRLPGLDLVRIQETHLAAAIDPDLPEYAAGENRVLLTHDARTMPGFAYDRVRAGQRMPGVIVCPQSLGIDDAIQDIALLAEVSFDEEWDDQVIYLPL